MALYAVPMRRTMMSEFGLFFSDQLKMERLEFEATIRYQIFTLSSTRIRFIKNLLWACGEYFLSRILYYICSMLTVWIVFRRPRNNARWTLIQAGRQLRFFQQTSASGKKSDLCRWHSDIWLWQTRPSHHYTVIFGNRLLIEKGFSWVPYLPDFNPWTFITFFTIETYLNALPIISN